MAAENGGQPPGRQRFGSATGIKTAAWYGVFWTKWGDALAEAGFMANKYAQKTSTNILLEKLAQACRHHGKFPTTGELRLYARQQANFPSHSAFTNGFSSRNEMLNQLATWTKVNPSFNDVVLMLPSSQQPADGIRATVKTSEGYVYLIQSGGFYKIGRSGEIERRVKEIRVALPDAAKLLHSIRTDDPPGIEAYWHRRFQDRRANGSSCRLLTSRRSGDGSINRGNLWLSSLR